MWDNIKKYWFVYLIGVSLCGFLVYYIFDLTRNNVSGKNENGVDVLASTSLGDVTSDEIFERFEDYSDNLLYSLYRNAVVAQSIETTSEMESTAKSFARNVESNMNADASGKTEISITSELASYGFLGIDKLYDYSLMTLKQQALDYEYVGEHFDEVKENVTSSPRTVSILTMEVADPENLSEDESSKQAEIETEIEENGFESAVAAFSDDLETVANDGFFGYVDANSTDLDKAVVDAAIALDKGEISDWISVTDSSSGTTSLYKVKVDETDLRTLFDDEDEDISDKTLSAIISADSSLEILAVQSKAKDMDIEYGSEEIQKRIEDFIREQTARNEETLEEENEEVVVEDEGTSGQETASEAVQEETDEVAE